MTPTTQTMELPLPQVLEPSPPRGVLSEITRHQQLSRNNDFQRSVPNRTFSGPEWMALIIALSKLAKLPELARESEANRVFVSPKDLAALGLTSWRILPMLREIRNNGLLTGLEFRDLTTVQGREVLRVGNAVSDVTFDLENNTLGILFHPAIYKLVSNLEGHFTRVKLSTLAELSNNPYALHLYEYLRTYVWEGRPNLIKVTLNEMRLLMGLRAEEYGRSTDLRRYVIDPAIALINQRTDLEVTHKVILQSRRLSGWNLSLRLRKPASQLDPYQTLVRDLLVEAGVAIHTADKLAGEAEPLVVVDGIARARRRGETKVQDMAAYVVTSVRKKLGITDPVEARRARFELVQAPLLALWKGLPPAQQSELYEAFVDAIPKENFPLKSLAQRGNPFLETVRIELYEWLLTSRPRITPKERF